MLYDLDRQPLADASVSILSSDPPLSVVTDLHGRFGLGMVKFGSVKIRIEKVGYETLTWEFRFIEASQVLYLQIPSADQLFEKAALALERKSWQELDGYLERGRRLEPKSLQGFILGASALEQRGNLADAIRMLESFPSDRPALVVELQLGDLYAAQGNKERAVAHWQTALKIKEDAVVRAKMDATMVALP